MRMLGAGREARALVAAMGRLYHQNICSVKLGGVRRRAFFGGNNDWQWVWWMLAGGIIKLVKIWLQL